MIAVIPSEVPPWFSPEAALRFFIIKILNSRLVYLETHDPSEGRTPCLVRVCRPEKSFQDFRSNPPRISGEIVSGFQEPPLLGIHPLRISEEILPGFSEMLPGPRMSEEMLPGLSEKCSQDFLRNPPRISGGEILPGF